MTHYLLIGGFWKSSPARIRDIKAAVNQRHLPAPRVLICLFSWPEDSWSAQFERIKGILQPELPTATFAMATLKDLRTQITAADVIYLNDGDNLLTEKALLGCDWLAGSLDGRLVIGSSAGANILASYYYSRTYREIRRELGVLPVKILAHYGAADAKGDSIDWSVVEAEIKNTGPTESEILKIPEGEAIAFER